MQRAFAAPAELSRRIGGLDAAAIAGMDARLERVFAERPALHRFPGTMARRVQELCAAIATDYGGDASRVWSDAADGADLKRRLLDLPGIGDMKVRSLLAVLSKRLGVTLPGLAEMLPKHPTLGDVDSPEARERYREAKRAYKASQRASS